MIALAISVLFGIVAVAALVTIAGAIAQGYKQARTILAELAQLDGRIDAASTQVIRRPQAPFASAPQLRHALA